MTLSPSSLSTNSQLRNFHSLSPDEAFVSNNNHDNIDQQQQRSHPSQQGFPTIALNDLPQGIEPPETFWNVLQKVNTKYRQDLQDYIDKKKMIDVRMEAGATIKNDIMRLQADLTSKNKEIKKVNEEIMQLTNEANKILETLQHRQSWFKRLNSPFDSPPPDGQTGANNNSDNIDIDAGGIIENSTNSNITPNRKKRSKGETSTSALSQSVSSSTSSSPSSNEMKTNSNNANRYLRPRQQRCLENKESENANTTTNNNNDYHDEKETSSSSHSYSSTGTKRLLNYDETDEFGVKRRKNHGRKHDNEGENKDGDGDMIAEEDVYDGSEADDDDNDDGDDDQTKLQHETTSASSRRSRRPDSNSNHDTKYVIRPKYRFPNIYAIILNHSRPLTKREIADIYKTEYKKHYKKWLKNPGDRSDTNWINFLFRCFDDNNHEKYLKDGLKIVSQCDGPVQTFRIQKTNND